MNQDPYILANPPKRKPVSDKRTYNVSIETKIDEALWNPDGAYGGVKSGTTPKGLDQGMFLFKKNQTPIEVK